MGNYFDYITGEFGFNMGDDSMLMNQEGGLLMRTSDTRDISIPPTTGLPYRRA